MLGTGQLALGPKLAAGGPLPLNPFLAAGWAALLANALNCIPVGESLLDRLTFFRPQDVRSMHSTECGP